MGYNTKYSLDISPKNYDLLERIIRDEELPFDWDGGCIDSMKWYDHDNDMLAVSEKYPEVLFILNGEGEENDDLWKAYYKDGKTTCIRAEIVYPEFSEDMLR